MFPFAPSQLLPSLAPSSISLAVIMLLLTAPLALVLTAVFGCTLPRVLPRSVISLLPILGLSILVAWLALACRELTSGAMLGMWALFLVSAALGGVAEMLSSGERAARSRRPHPVRQAVLANEVVWLGEHDVRPAYARTRYSAHSHQVPASGERSPV